MLKKIPVEVIAALPPEAQAKARPVLELAEQLVDVCNASAMPTPDVVLNALLNVYLNAAVQYGLAHIAAEKLVGASVSLAFEAAQGSATLAHSSSLH